MEKFRLVSMTDFVLEQFEKMPLQPTQQECVLHNLKIVNYAKFLKQPLTLGMFVPCDEDGNVIYQPKQTSLTCSFFEQQQFFNKQKKYEKAKGKVLFDGFEVKGNYIMYYDFMYMMKYELENKNLESIIEEIPNNNLTLTENALKQIGL